MSPILDHMFNIMMTTLRLRGGGKVGRDTGRSHRQHRPYKTPRDDGENNNNSKSSCGVFCGNLSFETTWQSLKDHMSKAGEVTRADILVDRSTGRSKGCGIVEYEDAGDARKAIDELHETELDGRQIFLREDRGESGGGGAGNGDGGDSPSTLDRPLTASRFGKETSGTSSSTTSRVYVGNLSWDVAWQDLKDFMRKAGDVVRAEVMTEPDGRSKGYGICEFGNERDAQTAIDTLNETELKGRIVYVREDTKDPPPPARGRDDRGSNDRDRNFGPRGTRGTGDRSADRGNSNSIYVWNLSYDTTWQRLEDHCRRTGNVDTATILTGHENRSIGCGVVVYQDAKGAYRALRELDNSLLDGREIRIREDRGHNDDRREDRGHNDDRREDRGHNDDRWHNYRRRDDRRIDTNNSGQLYVGNLSFKTSWQELKDHFRKCGQVTHADVIEGPDGRKRGFGIVRFSNIRDAERAIDELDGVELDGRSLEVRLDSRR